MHPQPERSLRKSRRARASMGPRGVGCRGMRGEGAARGPRAMVEKKLPFGALDFQGGAFFRRAGALARALAKIDELERIPGGRVERYLGMIPEDNACFLSEWLKYRMRADFAEPVPGVAGIGLLAMNDRVPVVAVAGARIVDQLVSFVEAGEIEPQTGHGSFGLRRTRKQIRCVMF